MCELHIIAVAVERQSVGPELDSGSEVELSGICTRQGNSVRLSPSAYAHGTYVFADLERSYAICGEQEVDVPTCRMIDDAILGEVQVVRHAGCERSRHVVRLRGSEVPGMSNHEPTATDLAVGRVEQRPTLLRCGMPREALLIEEVLAVVLAIDRLLVVERSDLSRIRQVTT